jgi:hypothetical protein
MKRKPGEDKAPSSAETAKILPPASPEEELEAFSPTPTEARRGPIKLTHPIKLPPGLLSLVALQLKTSSAGGLEIGEFFPRAYQLLCEEKKFLFGSEVRELAFIETNGRCREPFEGIDYSKFLTVPELKFDPANLEASCEMLRNQFKEIKLAKRNKTLAEHVGECHKAIHRAREADKELLRARGEPDAYGTAKQSYSAFAHGELAFVGGQIDSLRDYLDLRGKRVAPATAERRVLAKRRVLVNTPKAEEKNCS